ncbi:anti-sigma factor family protein [Paenibacillus albus]|uniref:Zf-HC2 domain-containing protein n=1 Tax=Paenibacillus albus TaxID=2495582 RepID=A0A3Q8X4P0_9BACL|nr:zf-HC2 domain-containing protein [Paenibacillus albus]AZN40422.1 zf-HC2 domain-containing protein [Paenibacillus albus]
MNCQEVTEYMQRQLDDDLNGEETEILMTHTRQCPECAAMMERLQLLNEGLENLPKVTPSYSLVDAILPRLAELKVSGEGAEEAAVEAVPAKVVPFDGAAKSGSGKRKWNERYTISAFAGIAAAAVVIVFFLFNYNPNRMGNSDNSTAVADTAAANSTNTSSTDSAADASTMEQKSELNAAANSAVERSSSDTSSDKSTSSSNAVKKSSDLKALKVDPNGEIMPPLVTGDSDKAAPTAGANAPNVEVTGSNDTADAGSDSKADGGASTDSTTSVSSSNTKAADDSAADSAASDNGINKETGGTVAMTDTATSDKKGNQNFTNSNTVIASPISPDGQYQAFIVENRIEIYTVQDSALVFQGVKHAGIANLKWSQDSKELTYETVSSDGAKKVFAIEVKSASEQEQSSNK